MDKSMLQIFSIILVIVAMVATGVGTIVGVTWSVRGIIADNSIAIAANVATIEANATAIEANAVAIDKLSDTVKANAAAIDKLREVVLSGNSAPV